MKLSSLLLIGMFQIIATAYSYSQVIVDSKAKVSNVDFFLVGDNLIITYDLLYSKSSELFTVSVSIKTESGKTINAKSFKGDIGESISGGRKKEIIWEISKDIAFLEEQIHIEVLAVNQNPKLINPVTKGKALLFSTVYPGLGSTKTTLKKYHFLTGVVAYSALSGAILYNEKSDESYSNYQAAELPVDRDKYFSASLDHNETANIMFYTAGAIWLSEYIIILASENRSRKTGFKSNIVYLGPVIAPRSNYTGISLIYNF